MGDENTAEDINFLANDNFCDTFDQIYEKHYHLLFEEYKDLLANNVASIDYVSNEDIDLIQKRLDLLINETI